MRKEHESNKHLTYEEREFIEIGLTKGRNFTEIGKDINKDRRTIAREVQKHKFKKMPQGFNKQENLCKHRRECGMFDCSKERNECYEEDICYKITGAPYVCNGCEEKKKCRKIKYYYYAKFANDEYEEKLRTSRYVLILILKYTKMPQYYQDKITYK